MGADKAFLEFEGQTLLARMLGLAQSITRNIWIVGSAAKFAAYAPMVEDIFRECGPLGGIHAALRSSQAELNLMIAVDMPFLSEALLHYLVARARNSSAMATVSRVDGRWQPLCAVYRREFADVAEDALRSGRYKIGALFNTENVHAVEETDLAEAGFFASAFRNLNTREDLAEAGAATRTPEAENR